MWVSMHCTCPYRLEGMSINITKRSTCRNRYIGETKRSSKLRLVDQRGYIVSKHFDKARGAHYNLTGHSLENLKNHCIRTSQIQ